jgi:polysaccharide biosynthesis/export protein
MGIINDILKKYFKLFLLIMVLQPLFFSCVTHRDLKYMQTNKPPDSYKEAIYFEYRLKPTDALYIQISSLDDASTNVFATSAGTETLDPYAAYMTSYAVDQEGYIQLPVIGKLLVAGKTTEEVSEMIKDAVANILSIPVVTVKLVNQYVSVLGYVNEPGHYVYSQDKLTIYEALSLAGDISEYGNRRQIMIVRNENGNNNRVSIDLTRTDVLSSPYYLIQPNDFIYVSPLKKRFWGLVEFPYTVLLATITTALLIYTVIEQ